MQPFSIKVGCRIHCDGEHGTVLYVGEVQGVEGTWLGIEWDNPSRGKHSGCYNNISYFKTRTSNAGSFIKISKADSGMSCVDAIAVKYGKNSDSTNTPAFFNLPQKTGQQRQIDFIGLQKVLGKQSNYAILTEIALSGMLVNNAGRPNELKELIPNIRNLDLSRNLLSSWHEVNDIARQLPHLQTLVLSKNKLVPEIAEICQDCYQSLKTLVLDYMSYSWKEVLTCAELWPFIQELRLLDNAISSLEQPPPPIFSNLRTLHLDNNPITNWNEICKLGRLTNLEELYIDNISLVSIQFPTVPSIEKSDLFLNLRILFVMKNNLNEWRSIGELNKLASLKNLMIKNNPIFESVTPETGRQLIIAKIKGLETLNRMKVEKSERRGAEVDYLKRYRSEWIANGGSMKQEESKPSTSFLDEHPTYLHLLQVHGAADENEIKTQSVLLKDNLISVRIFSPLLPDKPPLTRKLPAEMTVGKLKALVQRIFKVSAHEVTLTRLFKEDESQKTEMDNNLRDLSFYSVSDQDKIAVEW